jgi:hypothetical protein
MFLFHFAWFVFSGLFRVFAIILAGLLILNATEDAMSGLRAQVSAADFDNLKDSAHNYTSQLTKDIHLKLVEWRDEVSKNNLRHYKGPYRF